MNCQDFQDNLYDYLDETLNAARQAAAREHLRQCENCRHALAREKAVAQAIRHSLEQATAGLSLRPEVGRNVLQALETETALGQNPSALCGQEKSGIRSPKAPATSVALGSDAADVGEPRGRTVLRRPVSDFFQWLLATPLHLAGASAALLGLLLLVCVGPLRRQVQTHSDSQAVGRAGFQTCVIDVPMRSQIHIFRREGDAVVDGLVETEAVGYARFVTSPNLSEKPLRK